MRMRKKTRSFGLILSGFLVYVAYCAAGFAQENITPLPKSNAGGDRPVDVGSFQIVDFRTENFVEPEGIDAPNPRFSWKLLSQEIGDVQSAYRITVTKPLEGDAVVWDSGKVESDRQLYVAYDGEPLEPATKYAVELNVWNRDGRVKSRRFASFSTGLFPTRADPNPWKGKWIGCSSREESPEPADVVKGGWIAYAPSISLPPGPSVYRKTFEIDDLDSIEKAVGNFSIDNNGTVVVNGVDIGGSFEIRRAFTRILTSYLKEGKNVVAIHADNGASAPNPGGVFGGFYLQRNDGSKVEYLTDETWKAIEGFDDSYVALDFDDSRWTNASVVRKHGEKPWGEILTPPVEEPSYARYLSNAFRMKENADVKRAVVFISGLGYNECYLNGTRLGDQICGPMYADYDKTVPYNAYDATEILRQIKNDGLNDVEVGVALGNGRYYSMRMGLIVHYGDPCLLFQMQIEYADGSKDVFVSDESWKGTDDGPISENSDFDGEIVDARKAKLIAPDSEERFFKEGFKPRYLETRFGKTFVVDTPFDVDVVDGPKGKLISQTTPPCARLLRLKPSRLRRWNTVAGSSISARISSGFPVLKSRARREPKFKFASPRRLFPTDQTRANFTSTTSEPRNRATFTRCAATRTAKFTSRASRSTAVATSN